jgi:hypothetical protein
MMVFIISGYLFLDIWIHGDGAHLVRVKDFMRFSGHHHHLA